MYFTKHIFTFVTPYVSIFAEIPLTPASPQRNGERSRNVGHVLKTRGNGAVEVSFESGTAQTSDLHVRFLSCVISLIVLTTLPSPSSAVLLQ